MDVCADVYQVRHSEFLSWDKLDRDKAIVHYIRKRETCTCGTRPDEWDPKRGGSRDAYRADFAECPGCVERERASEAPELKEQRGLRVVLIRNRGV